LKKYRAAYLTAIRDQRFAFFSCFASFFSLAVFCGAFLVSFLASLDFIRVVSGWLQALPFSLHIRAKATEYKDLDDGVSGEAELIKKLCMVVNALTLAQMGEGSRRTRTNR